MNQKSVLLAPFPAFIFVVFAGIFAAWLWFFHPSCYEPVLRYETQTKFTVDTVWAPAPYRIEEVVSTDIQEGKRPRKPEGVIENIEKIWLETTQKKEYTEVYYFVLQSVRFQNTSMDTATFAMRGWVRITAFPNQPIQTEIEKIRLAPGQFYTFHFRVDLPPGYDLQILDSLNEYNCVLRASPARVVRKHEFTEKVPRKIQCNRCCEVCEDEVVKPDDLIAPNSISKRKNSVPVGKTAR